MNIHFAWLLPLLLGAAALPASGQMASGKSKFLGSTLGPGSDPTFPTYWNQATSENQGKWEAVEWNRNSMNWGPLDAHYNYCQSRGYAFKGHTLVWGMQQPRWIDSLTPAEQRAEVEEWIRLFCQRYPNIAMIDVVNEPITQPASYRAALGGEGATGWDWVIWCFEKARQYAPPGTKLVLNEWGIDRDSAKMKRYVEIIQLLKDRGLIDVVGVQGHFLEGINLPQIQRNMNRLEAIGLPVTISEFDLNIGDDARHKAKFEQLFTYFWEHPLVNGMTHWGYKEGQMWQTSAFLLRSNGTERPALTWLKNYVPTVGEGAGLPARPTAFTGTPAANGAAITLTWQDPAINETGFRLEMREDGVVAHDVLAATLPANTTSYTVSGLQPGTTYRFRVRAFNANGYSWWNDSAVIQTPGTAVVVDDAQAAVTGKWTGSMGSTTFVGDGFRHDNNAEKGGKTMTFRPNLPTAGSYRVFLRWGPGANNADAVPVDIHHAGGVDPVAVDQRTGGGEWVLLGTYNFASGTNGRVVVSNAGTSGLVSADAVKFLRPPAATGSLSLQAATQPAGTVNLTTLGGLDWIAWARSGLSTDRKATGGSRISSWTQIGSSTPARIASSTVTFQWTDGTPVVSGSSTGIVRVSGANNGLEFTVDAGPTQQTLRVYAATQYSARAILEASLEDGSAPAQSIQVQGSSGTDTHIFTVQFRAAGQSRLKLRLLSPTGTGTIGLRAAALQ